MAVCFLWIQQSCASHAILFFSHCSYAETQAVSTWHRIHQCTCHVCWVLLLNHVRDTYQQHIDPEQALSCATGAEGRTAEGLQQHQVWAALPDSNVQPVPAVWGQAVARAQLWRGPARPHSNTFTGAASVVYWKALINLETSFLIQKRHPNTGNLNSERSGDSKNTILHCGDV